MLVLVRECKIPQLCGKSPPVCAVIAFMQKSRDGVAGYEDLRNQGSHCL